MLTHFYLYIFNFAALKSWVFYPMILYVNSKKTTWVYYNVMHSGMISSFLLVDFPYLQLSGIINRRLWWWAGCIDFLSSSPNQPVFHFQSWGDSSSLIVFAIRVTLILTCNRARPDQVRYTHWASHTGVFSWSGAGYQQLLLIIFCCPNVHYISNVTFSAIKVEKQILRIRLKM